MTAYNLTSIHEVTSRYDHIEIGAEKGTALLGLELYRDFPESEIFQRSADTLEALTTAEEMEKELRAQVAERLNAGRMVEIPGLGLSVRVYA